MWYAVAYVSVFDEVNAEQVVHDFNGFTFHGNTFLVPHPFTIILKYKYVYAVVRRHTHTRTHSIEALSLAI